MTVTVHDCPHQRGRTLPCSGRDCAGALHACWHCHDDPPAGHVCPCCGARPAHGWRVRCADGRERHRGHPFAGETPAQVKDTWDRACRKGPHSIQVTA